MKVYTRIQVFLKTEAIFNIRYIQHHIGMYTVIQLVSLLIELLFFFKKQNKTLFSFAYCSSHGTPSSLKPILEGHSHEARISMCHDYN